MKRNIIIKTIYITLLALVFVACNDVFDELAVNPNQQDVNGYYSTPENINKGVIGIYSYITTPRAMGASGGRLLINRGDEGSDRSDYGAPGQYSAQLSPSWYTIVQPYQLFYTAASQASQMIEVIPNVEFSNETIKNAYLGEAYFLRAYAHWFLFLNFRNIPLIKELPNSAKDYKPQSTPEETWEFIIDDLKKAKALLPQKGFWSDNYKGRITQGAATSLLGKAYLYRSGIEKYYGKGTTTYYNEAAAAFDEVIKSGLYDLVDDYNDNFKVATENNKESIFELQFVGDAVNTGFNPGSSTGGVWRDPRGYYPPTPRNGASNVIHDWVYDAFVASKDANGKTDYRMFGTLIFNDADPSINPKDGDEVRVFDNQTFKEYYGAEGFASVNSQVAKYKAACRKGIDWTLPTENPGNKLYMWYARAQGLNMTQIRYADVLLMYAEAVISGGKQGAMSAIDAINKVRSRKSVNLPPVASADMQIIETERVLELTQEGHRFFDLLRWGKVAQRFKVLEQSDPNFKKYGTSAYLGFVENKNEWLPLPVDEVEGNPYITKNNPGWN